MVDVNIDTDLAQVTQQMEQLIGEYNKKDTEMKQLMQQIQNLSGIAMYLRGKIGDESPKEVSKSSNNIGNNETLDTAKIISDS